ncbi:MAG: glycosyltransferase [Candidatus Omnitrophica bacterium]|nr:glycosyltransferase [Candidatus Omnitrophota bacterium]
MGSKKALLLYISEHSGHHCASNAIERALKAIDHSIQTLNINSFNYTNPILEKVINRAYMGVVKRTPEIWDYLYDNPKVLKNTQRLRELFHKFNTGKLKNLLDDFKPSVVICTQAFPCGMVADYKKTFGLDIPLIGILTDYAPHSYWIYNNVDLYIVPSPSTGQKLVDDGVDPSKVMVCGIPIESRFAKKKNRSEICSNLGLDLSKPCVLIMGGTQGLGPIKELVRALDESPLDAQFVVAAGTNKKLWRWLRRHKFKKKALCFAYTDNIDELMEASTLVITKPGGITTAEALAKGLPMLIVNPLPGQEAMNTKFLLSEGVAIKASSPQDAVVLVEELLYNKDKLTFMSEKARSLARPDSAVQIAELALELARS